MKLEIKKLFLQKGNLLLPVFLILLCLLPFILSYLFPAALSDGPTLDPAQFDEEAAIINGDSIRAMSAGADQEEVSKLDEAYANASAYRDALYAGDYAAEIKYGYLHNQFMLAKEESQGDSPFYEQRKRLVAEYAFFRTADFQRIDPKNGEPLPFLNYLAGLFNVIPYEVFLVFFSLFFASVFTWEKRHQTIDFLYLLPRSKRCLFWQRFLPPQLAIFLFLAVTIGVVMVVTTSFAGFGRFAYPIFYTNASGVVVHFPIGTFLLKVFIGLVLTLLMLGLLCYLASLYTGNLIVVVLLCLITVLPGILPNYLQLVGTQSAKFLPFTYINLPNLLQNQRLGTIPGVVWQNGLIWLAGLSTFFAALIIRKEH